MLLNPDFKDMLSALSEIEVEFLLVGAYAMAAHGYPRATGDLDIWVRADSQNAKKVYDALAKFGAPLHELTVDDLSTPGIQDESTFSGQFRFDEQLSSYDGWFEYIVSDSDGKGRANYCDIIRAIDIQKEALPFWN
ncbi:MAG: hypothetical protein ACI9HK_002417 [Pirellulaceae bacterium]|jgi:hypothetical protein